MRLLVVSHTPHHLRAGQVVGWGATVRELDALASRFAAVRHVACLYPGEAPTSAIAYQADNVELVPVPPAGGDGARGKLDALAAVPRYAAAIARELPRADVVHVRAPANIALVALALLSVSPRPRVRWFKYAGNWQPERGDRASYALQRWLLRRPWHRGQVTVNGAWPGEPRWVHAFDNPSLTDEDLAAGRAAADAKQLAGTVRMVYVGRVEPHKGAGRALEIVERCRTRGLDVALDLVGDGPDRERLAARARELGLGERVRFAGWRAPAELRDYYRSAHISLLPTATEGWPKVLSEGMAYGAVPLAGAVGSIPSTLAELRVGAAIAADAIDAYVDAIAGYVRAPVRWHDESQRAAAGASRFSFAAYLAAVDRLLAEARP
jgi:glycosyltransferase involved in cell wall biosynthesis